MRVVLSDWIVGDGQTQEPVLGEVIPQRMLLMATSRLVSIDPDLAIGPDDDREEGERLIGVVTWRGSNANGDAAVLDCGFPVRVESELKAQNHRPARSHRGFRGPGSSEWLIPVDLDIPSIGTQCAVWGELRLAADHEMEDVDKVPDHPNVRRDWLIRDVTFRASGSGSWLLDLQATAV
jgi:hypothetical protein